MGGVIAENCILATVGAVLVFTVAGGAQGFAGRAQARGVLFGEENRDFECARGVGQQGAAREQVGSVAHRGEQAFLHIDNE